MHWRLSMFTWGQTIQASEFRTNIKSPPPEWSSLSLLMLMALEVQQPVCWKYRGSSDGARLRPTLSWELDVRWFEEPLVTMISRMVVFEMVYDTTIEFNEPGCPSEVGHPIILCHGSNPFVRKFKFRFAGRIFVRIWFFRCGRWNLLSKQRI